MGNLREGHEIMIFFLLGIMSVGTVDRPLPRIKGKGGGAVSELTWQEDWLSRGQNGRASVNSLTPTYMRRAVLPDLVSIPALSRDISLHLYTQVPL